MKNCKKCLKLLNIEPNHIIPLAFAKNEKELLLINHYINLRPIWIKDNQLKSDNIEIKNAIYELIMNQRVYFDM